MQLTCPLMATWPRDVLGIPIERFADLVRPTRHRCLCGVRVTACYLECTCSRLCTSGTLDRVSNTIVPYVERGATKIEASSTIDAGATKIESIIEACKVTAEAVSGGQVILDSSMPSDLTVAGVNAALEKTYAVRAQADCVIHLCQPRREGPPRDCLGDQRPTIRYRRPPCLHTVRQQGIAHRDLDSAADELGL